MAQIDPEVEVEQKSLSELADFEVIPRPQELVEAHLRSSGVKLKSRKDKADVQGGQKMSGDTDFQKSISRSKELIEARLTSSFLESVSRNDKTEVTTFKVSSANRRLEKLKEKLSSQIKKLSKKERKTLSKLKSSHKSPMASEKSKKSSKGNDFQFKLDSSSHGAKTSVYKYAQKPDNSHSITGHESDEENEYSSTQLVTDCQPEQQLLSIVEETSVTAIERLKVLNARDSLMRLREVKQEGKRKKAIGCCPDMCPEKERYGRIAKNCLSVLEMKMALDPMMTVSRDADHRFMVKEYSRSSADQKEPLLHELRPVSVLMFTMDYLICNIMDLKSNNISLRDWYDFIWNRTRSIRKDITQQQLCDLNCVAIIEKCVRFHIHCAEALSEEDTATFDAKINNENLTKCLQTLKHMYHDLQTKGIQCPNEAEFRAYDILLSLTEGEALRLVKDISKDILKSPLVKSAFEAALAFKSHNYVKFFKIIEKAPYLCSCILHRYILDARIFAMQVIVRAYATQQHSTPYPLSSLIRDLKFENHSEAYNFCKLHGLAVDAEYVTIDRQVFHKSYSLPVTRSKLLVGSKLKTCLGMVVNSGPLPENPLNWYQPHCSFDEKNKLKKESIDAFDQKKERQMDIILSIVPDMEVMLHAAKDENQISFAMESYNVQQEEGNVAAVKHFISQAPEFSFGKENKPVQKQVKTGINLPQFTSSEAIQSFKPVEVTDIFKPPSALTPETSLMERVPFIHPLDENVSIPNHKISKFSEPVKDKTQTLSESRFETDCSSQCHFKEVSEVQGITSIFPIANQTVEDGMFSRLKSQKSLVEKRSSVANYGNLFHDFFKSQERILPKEAGSLKKNDQPKNEYLSLESSSQVKIKNPFGGSEKKMKQGGDNLLQICDGANISTNTMPLIKSGIKSFDKEFRDKDQDRKTKIEEKEAKKKIKLQKMNELLHKVRDELHTEGIKECLVSVCQEVVEEEQGRHSQEEDIFQQIRMQLAEKAIFKWRLFCERKRQRRFYERSLPSSPWVPMLMNTEYIKTGAANPVTVYKRQHSLSRLTADKIKKKKEIKPGWEPLNFKLLKNLSNMPTFPPAYVGNTEIEKFFKLCLVFPAASEASEMSIFSKWIASKLSFSDAENVLNDESKLWKVFTLNDQKMVFCIQIIELEPDADFKNTTLLDGISAMLLCIPSTFPNSESFRVILQKFTSLLDAEKLWYPYPLFILLLATKEKYDVTNQLSSFMIEKLDSGFFSDVKMGHVFEVLNLSENSNEVISAINWLIENQKCFPVVLNCSFKSYLEDSFTYAFNTLYWKLSISEFKFLKLIPQQIINFCNRVFKRRASLLLSDLLIRVSSSWPPEELSVMHPDYQFIILEFQKEMKGLMDLLFLPDFEGDANSENELWDYLEKVAKNEWIDSQMLIISIKSSLEISGADIDWLNIIQRCAYYTIQGHYSNLLMQKFSESSSVYYIKDDVDSLDFDELWQKVLDLKKTCQFQAKRRELDHEQESLAKKLKHTNVDSEEKEFAGYQSSSSALEKPDWISSQVDNLFIPLQEAFKKQREESDLFIEKLNESILSIDLFKESTQSLVFEDSSNHSSYGPVDQENSNGVESKLHEPNKSLLSVKKLEGTSFEKSTRTNFEKNTIGKNYISPSYASSSIADRLLELEYNIQKNKIIEDKLCFLLEN